MKYLSETYESICRELECKNYIEWSFGYGTCYSCKPIGESHTINNIPDNCINSDKIKIMEGKK